MTVLPAASNVTLMNRTARPDAILDIVEERCGGDFDDIEDVISHEEMTAHAANYKSAAGYRIEETSASAPTIPASARIGDSTRAG